MKTALACIPCFVRQAAEVVALSDSDVSGHERLMRCLLREIMDADWNVIPVTLTRSLQRRVRAETGSADPYRSLKARMNCIALDLLPSLMETARRQADPHEAVVRLAIAGNLLDAGSKNRLDPEDLPAHLQSIWNTPLTGSVTALFEAAHAARHILYLSDNAGEIVLDRLLIEALPMHKITVAVRGAPVINDATLEDAKTAGLVGLVPVIANGSDAPGTLLEACSREFQACFRDADLVISKGQGNYETLSDMDKNVFFLLTVKCPVIAADIGAPVGALVVQHTNARRSG